MVNVNVNGLQYKMVGAIFKNPNRNLCMYFSQCAWSWIVMIGVLVTVVSTIVAPYFVYAGVLGEESSWQFAMFLSIGVLVWLVVSVLSIVFAMIMVVEGIKWVYFKTKKYAEPQNPGMIVSYIKAKKEKVCPRINFVDE